MSNRGKSKIIGKISLLTFGNSNSNGTITSSSSSNNNNINNMNNNENKIKIISETQIQPFHMRSRSSYKCHNISNNLNNRNLDNFITNIPNPNSNLILSNNNNDNQKNATSQIYHQYQTTSSFTNLNKPLKQFRSLSPNYDKSRRKYLLPKKNSKKKTLVLDLDETLVHSCGVPFNCPSDFIIQIEQDNDIHDIHVLVRPHVEEFLEKMSKRYELVIFTASISKYANPLLNIIDKMGFVPFRLFREHCTLINTTFVKDLTLLGRDLKDIIILDNNPTAYSLNHYNGFPIKSWFDDKNDEELLKITPILEFLSYVPDVRDYIKKIVYQNQVQFDIVKQVIVNYNNNLKKNLIPPECKKIYDLFREDNNSIEKMLQKSKSTKLSIIKAACNNGCKYNNCKNRINNYTNINIINNNNNINYNNYNKIFTTDEYPNNNSYFVEQKNNKIKNINVRVVKNRLTGKRVIKKRDILPGPGQNNNFLKRKKMGINTMRYNFSNNKIIYNKNNKNCSSNCIINNINNININISNNCGNNTTNKNNITENININHINNSGSCVKHQRIYFNNNINTKRKISANASETRNNKIYGNSKEISLNNNGLSMKLNQSQKAKPKNKFNNKIQLINVGGGLKIDIKFLREQFKVYLKDYKRENHNNERILRQIFKNRSINLSHSQKIEN
jgi:RNA polymerase II subunit A small phosphatase-like protein